MENHLAHRRARVDGLVMAHEVDAKRLKLSKGRSKVHRTACKTVKAKYEHDIEGPLLRCLHELVKFWPAKRSRATLSRNFMTSMSCKNISHMLLNDVPINVAGEHKIMNEREISISANSERRVECQDPVSFGYTLPMLSWAIEGSAIDRRRSANRGSPRRLSQSGATA